MADHLSCLIHNKVALQLKTTSLARNCGRSQSWIRFGDRDVFVILSMVQMNNFQSEDKYYIWEDTYPFKIYPGQVIQRCVPEIKFQ